ncbi:unnamed protein product [Urochloa humidicola]
MHATHCFLLPELSSAVSRSSFCVSQALLCSLELAAQIERQQGRFELGRRGSSSGMAGFPAAAGALSLDGGRSSLSQGCRSSRGGCGGADRGGGAETEEERAGRGGAGRLRPGERGRRWGSRPAPLLPHRVDGRRRSAAPSPLNLRHPQRPKLLHDFPNLCSTGASDHRADLVAAAGGAAAAEGESWPATGTMRKKMTAGRVDGSNSFRERSEGNG